MTARHFHRLLAAIFLIIVNLLAPHQTVQSAESGTTDSEDIPTPLAEFQAFSTAGQYAKAMAVAARVVEQASDDQSATRASLVEPLLKLAMVKKQSGDYFAASRTGELAIELIERNGGVFDPALVEPLVFLAQVEQAGGRHPAALERLYRAQHILHRAEGVMTQLQLPILALMTKSYAAIKQSSNTNMTIEQSFAIKMRDLDENSIESVPVFLEQAEIRAMNGQLRMARELIYLGLDILNQSLPENDPGFLEVLDGLASVRYMEVIIGDSGVGSYRLGHKEGTRALREMIAIMDEHHEQYSAVQRAETNIWLGDWYMLLRKPDLADVAYRNAWQILSLEENAEKLLESYFGQPRQLRYTKPMPPRYGPGMYEVYYGKFAEVKFSVGANGKVRKVMLVNSNSPSAMNTRMRAAVQRAIYRPRYVDAQPVVTSDLLLREDFARGAWPAKE